MRLQQFLISLLGTAALSACQSETKRLSGYEVHGIDVSRYQGMIDWELVAEKDIDFVFIKATEGATFRDSQFFCNWDALRETGMRRGAYHFFRPQTSAVEQAEHFIFMVEAEPGDLPPVLDLETLDGVEPEALVDSALVWLKMVEASYQVKPILYSGMNFYNDHLQGRFDDYPLWIARYNRFFEPHLKGKKSWDF